MQGIRSSNKTKGNHAGKATSMAVAVALTAAAAMTAAVATTGTTMSMAVAIGPFGGRHWPKRCPKGGPGTSQNVFSELSGAKMVPK